MRDINWYSENLSSPEWDNPEKSFLAFLTEGNGLEATGEEKESDILVVLNSHREEKLFHLPTPRSGAVYYRVLDTSLPPGRDLPEDENEHSLTGRDSYLVAPQSTVVFIRKNGKV